MARIPFLSTFFCVSILIAFATAIWGCEKAISPSTWEEQAGGELELWDHDPDAPQQIEGIVSFPDSTYPQGWPLIRAYYDDFTYVPGSQDYIDTNGHYGCSGEHQYWPTGWYYLVTDAIYRTGNWWQGTRWSYHEYEVRTLNQDIMLTMIDNPER